ncbi:GNAT family N-acetyltransferase [Flavobacterium sp. 3HN19-14]|uniref:GNAT family N-acetyltransferase n=1 Tax=Flavobacterium sp. 3HN19-14 TaxID=3448133 RepID=UPI003EDF54F3
MIAQTELTTSRLLLKSITPDLIKEIFRHQSEKGIIAFFETDADGYDRLKSMYEKGMETHRLSLFYFLIHDKISGKVIGECGFHSWNKTHDRAELFYNLKNDSDKKKGLMTEALEAVLDFGFNELQLHRIEALIAAYNIPSVKLVQRYGFTKEGTMREDYIVDGKYENSECYSLLKWEWKTISRNKLP